MGCGQLAFLYGEISSLLDLRARWIFAVSLRKLLKLGLKAFGALFWCSCHAQPSNKLPIEFFVHSFALI